MSPAPEKVNVLLVDDQASRLLSYEAILLELGLNLVKAQSGREALSLLMEREFALILLDVNMPEMDGFETATLIHQHPRFERVPIIFITAFSVSELDRLRGYNLGAIDYVHVPVVPEILRSKVAVLVELFQQRQQLRRLNENLEVSNDALARANDQLRDEKARKLRELNLALERSNADLERSNIALQAEIGAREKDEETIRELNAVLSRRVEELTTLIEFSPVGIAIAEDGHGRRIHVNRALRRLLDVGEGRQLELDVGERERPYRFLRDGAELMPEDLPIQRALRLGADIEGLELDLVRADGAQFSLVHSVRPLFDSAGQPRGSIGVFVDITERKRMEERLREADRRKDEFLALLGHELRNPLAPIRSALHIMKRVASDDVALSAPRAVIERQVDHLARLVDDLLDVARITRGKIELRRELVRIDAMLERALETCQPLFETRHHQVTIRNEVGDIFIDGDVTRLAQVVSNILNNAAKYTPDRGRIELLAQRDGSWVRILVSDSGMGIPAAMLHAIFEPFRQVDAPRDQSLGGLGIGLALVRRLVEMHGGSVSAMSEGPGRGSSFEVLLPVAATSGVLRHPDAPERAGPAVHRRVMIADDNVDAAEMLAMMLRLEGHQVEIANDGEQAVQLARQFLPHVVLLDIGMPRLDGYEAARRILAQPWGRDMTLIALTGWGQPDDRQRSREAGFSAHCVKPVDSAEIIELVATARNGVARG